MSALSAAYGRAATLRRAWYRHRPHLRRRLEGPVISVGNLVVGGSGKTPVVAALARELLAIGERPAILSRGYARRKPAEGVVVASDGRRVLTNAECAGDEPYMLARALPGVSVLVSPDRHLAGRLGERSLGATVSILDDGFQHVQLARDVDLLLMSASDLEENVIPSGRLREPLGAAATADALLVVGGPEDAARMRDAVGVERVFSLAVRPRPLRLLQGSGDVPVPDAGGRAAAFAAIARPERFFALLRHQGWTVIEEMAFRDHHWFKERELARILERARGDGADVIVTTEKDAARLESSSWFHGFSRELDVPLAVLPVESVIEPSGEFVEWIRHRLTLARGASGTA